MTPTQPPAAPFQKRVLTWMMKCFSMQVCLDSIERNHRFLEEALELVQSNGCTVSEAHQLVDYVFNRPVGEIKQECGGVMVTLAALSLAADIDMHDCGEVELSRIMQPGIMDKIRAKQAAKPKHSPLPQAAAPDELMREVALKIFRYFENKYHLKLYGNIKPDHNNILCCMDDVNFIATALQSAGPQQAEQVEPTEEMWSGLARDIVMWVAMDGPHYGSKLYKHLRMLGKEIPAWLLKEIPDIDHTPPKGTMAVCIYKAVLSAAPQLSTKDDGAK